MFLFSKKINIFSILKFLLFTKLKINLFNKKFRFRDQKIILFSRSRWSLLFIVFLYEKFLDQKKIINIWVPSYFCNYALSKIRKYNKNVNFIFYPIDQNFKIDIKKILKMSSINPIHIFINVNYFGKSLKNYELINILNKNKTWLINDCTHCISPSEKFEKYSDFSIYSPHKFYSLPSGAICKINFNGINKILLKEKINNIEELKREFLKKIGISYFKVNFYDLYCNSLWLMKRIINIFYKKIKILDFDDQPSETNVEIDNKPFPSFLTSKLIINTIVIDTRLHQDRRRTLFLWKDILKKLLKNKFEYNFFINNIDNPFNLIIQSDTQSIKNIYSLLKKFRIPISTWPDLPSEVNSDLVYNDTFSLRNKLIFINLNPQKKSQLKLINNLNKEFIYNKKNFKFEEINNQVDWERNLNLTNFSYLTALYNYYDNLKFFKSKKYLIKDNLKDIGIFQILYLDLGIFTFIRLNLGPCYFENVNDNFKKDVLNQIFNNFYSKKIKIFYVSPNLNFSEENILIQLGQNILSYSGNSWHSIVINLEQKLKSIKENLKGSLRRDIHRKNISNNFNIRKVISSNDFLIFINNYKSEMKRKKFVGASVGLIKKLYLNNKLIIFNAYSDNKIISTICVAKHGNTATYLVGLNLDLNKSVNDLLLWKILVLLKRTNYTKFDLGGIDYENNKNVSIFKSNFGGEEYKLIGSKILII